MQTEWPPASKLGHLLRPRGEQAAPHGSLRRRDQARAELDDDPHRPAVIGLGAVADDAVLAQPQVAVGDGPARAGRPLDVDPRLRRAVQLEAVREPRASRARTRTCRDRARRSARPRRRPRRRCRPRARRSRCSRSDAPRPGRRRGRASPSRHGLGRRPTRGRSAPPAARPARRRLHGPSRPPRRRAARRRRRGPQPARRPPGRRARG